jgi:hypothetical protein
MRVLKKAALVLTMAAAFVGIGVAPASASSASYVCAAWTTSTCPGEAYFSPFTGYQKLAIYDNTADGYWVAVVNYRSDMSPSGPYYGYDANSASGLPATYTLHMPAGATIQYYVCLGVGAHTPSSIIGSTCGSWAYGQA